MKQVPIFIDGKFIKSVSNDKIEVTNPATQDIIAEVPCATEQEIKKAVESAKNAFLTWREVPVSERARLFFKYQQALKDQQDDIAKILSEENGKTFEDAKGDVWRGIEVVEQACHAPALMMGETVENVSRSIDTYSYLQPLGVCVGITPFNFPAMIPLWMFPLALACGNTFVLKPSEQDPLTPLRLLEIFNEVGFPKGILNMVHGRKEAVDGLITHPDVKACSFVGSASVAEYVYKKGTEHLKRVQAFAGAKNHMVIMPDANKDQVLQHLAGASCGAAGQRCMAISVGVFVGSAQEWISELKGVLSKLKPGAGTDTNSDFGPLISKKARQRVLSLIEKGKKEGATLLVDGSSFKHSKYPQGNFVGPTLFDKVTNKMSIYQEEIFGPVLLCVRVNTLEEALKFINSNPFGNGTSIFTNSGAAARKFQHEVEVGQVGINIPIPVPLPFFSFTGWKRSFFGDQHAYGKQAIRFFTETKTIISRWFGDGEVQKNPNMTIQMK